MQWLKLLILSFICIFKRNFYGFMVRSNIFLTIVHHRSIVIVLLRQIYYGLDGILSGGHCCSYYFLRYTSLYLRYLIIVKCSLTPINDSLKVIRVVPNDHEFTLLLLRLVQIAAMSILLTMVSIIIIIF